MMRYVVGVAGAAGAGKTSLVQSLVRSMADAVAIHVDNYQGITREPVHKLMEWMRRGGNFDEFDIASLPEHLDCLKRGASVVDPASGSEIASSKYIIFETHFGRAHRATGRYIDLLIWIDTPLDVALARNVKDFLEPVLQNDAVQPTRDRAAWIFNYLENYLANVRDLVRMQKETISIDADIVVDGSDDVRLLTARVRREIEERLP